eukprot:8107033-Alexandrium_andersonii.AAC.1
MARRGMKQACAARPMSTCARSDRRSSTCGCDVSVAALDSPRLRTTLQSLRFRNGQTSPSPRGI